MLKTIKKQLIDVPNVSKYIFEAMASCPCFTKVAAAAVLCTWLVVPQLTTRMVRKVWDQQDDPKKLNQLVVRDVIFNFEACLDHLRIGQVDHAVNV